MATNRLLELIAPSVEAMGYELWGCELSKPGKESLLRVYIEREQGVTVDDCAKLSRQIAAVLDVEDPISGAYRLEVSSPGLDRPLYKIAHYKRYIGKKAHVRLRLPREGRRNFTGVIESVEDQSITLCLEMGETLVVLLSDIDKATLVLEV